MSEEDHSDDDNVSVKSGEYAPADLMMGDYLDDVERISVLERKVDDLETRLAEMETSRGGKKTRKRKQSKKPKTKRRNNKKR
jgi:hypothetical protein